MIKKICPNCLQSSYSAYDNPEWFCLYCGKKIPQAVIAQKLQVRSTEKNYTRLVVPFLKDRTIE